MGLRRGCIPSSSNPSKSRLQEKNPEGLSKGSTAGSGACRQPLGSPAQLLLSAETPLVRVPAPLNILLLLCASSFASENTEPSSLSLQLQPHVCLSALLVPQNLPPAPGCRGEQSMRVAIRQERLHHPPPSPNPSPLPHTHPLPAPLAARTVRKGQVTRRPPPRDGGGWRQEVLPPPVGGGHSDGGWDLQRACSPPRSGRR